MSDYYFTRLSRARWSVTRGGDLNDGDQPFTLCHTSKTVNVMGDFCRKRDAEQWVSQGCPVEDDETLIWAKTAQSAVEKAGQL